jgi:hypothetical protein
MALKFGQGVFGQSAFGGVAVSSVSSSVPAPVTTGYAATLAFDPTTNDLALSGLKILRGDAAIAQKVKQRLRFYQGEWFLDTRLGVPYIQVIFPTKPVSIPALQAIFRRVLLSVPQIVSVQSLDIALDPVERSGTIDFVAIIEDGRTLTATAEPFIV